MHRRNGAAIGCRAFVVVSMVALTACGGGGGNDGGSPANPGISHAPSANSARQCAAPRPAGAVDLLGRPYNDRQGSVDSEKRWVGAWHNETYLWYRESPDRGPQAHASAVSYFSSLRTTATTASGRAKDQFHFTYDTAEYQAMSQGGVSMGYGFTISVSSPTPPRRVVVAYTDPGTPAAAAGIPRGAEILSVDGVDVVNDGSASGVAVLNAGLAPSRPGTHTFMLRNTPTSPTRLVSLNASAVTLVPVQNVRTLPEPYQQVGYLLFNDHIATSEPALITAIQQLALAGVTDLVIDLRYNGGGYLGIASELAYMVAGPSRTQNRTFEELIFNDKNPFGLTASERNTPFHSTSQGFSGAAGQPLPTLNLGRVYVLVSGDTCSASESLVNGLRGVGVQVVLVGTSTCGKPYGFLPTDNCSTTYFTVQFRGVNHLGQGDYADGFAPNCTVADDFTHALGDPAEASLSLALGHRATGTWVRAVGRAGPRAAQPAVEGGSLMRSVLRENRLYRER
ncbi:MAG: S41 family peptidase [Rhizobacter sp.]